MRAFVITESDDSLSLAVKDVESTGEAEDLLVAVDYSGINFKDAMVAAPKSRVRRVASLIGGVDAAGTVERSSDPALPVGTRVAVHGGTLGVSRDGGFAQSVYSPARYVTALPDSISTRVAMIVGTAGFTAMESLLALEDRGLASDAEVLVTGATGGVGSQAVSFLAARGYRAVASTGTASESQWLKERGAARVIGRDEIADNPGRVLASETWDGAIDCVGGDTLAQILRSLRYGGAVAASGLVGSAELATTVYPFITRSVALLGIDSVEASTQTRARVWAAIGEVASRVDFEALAEREIRLEALASALDVVRNGNTRGRILVNPTPE
ncbi:MAG: acryloyl-CoA reductase [Acidimicrobiales bacterium]